MKCKLPQDIRKETLDKLTEDYSIALVSVLYDKTNLNEDEIFHLLSNVQNLFDSITKGYVSIYDLKQTLKEEHGLFFSRR